jgi:hypothetical protein
MEKVSVVYRHHSHTHPECAPRVHQNLVAQLLAVVVSAGIAIGL